MLDRVRLLPVLIVCTALLFGFKVVNLATGVEQHLASRAYAETQEPGSDVVADATAAAGEEAGGSEDAAGPAVPAVSGAVMTNTAAQQFTPSEAAVLASLAERRDKLDQRQRDADLREQLLRATEKRVEERIGELKEIEARIAAYIGDEDQASEEQLASLVKMYESMKPKDAARIFERLDMGVLLTVVERMNARKMAAVLANMDPVLAQELTVELATRRQLPESLEELAPAVALPDQG